MIKVITTHTYELGDVQLIEKPNGKFYIPKAYQGDLDFQDLDALYHLIGEILASHGILMEGDSELGVPNRC